MTDEVRRLRPRDYVRVYRAVRRADHGWWRALSCCNRVRQGSWPPRDAGEMRAQASLMADAVRRASK